MTVADRIRFPVLRVFALILGLTALWPGQSLSREHIAPVTVGWAPLPGMREPGPDGGDPTGFMPELARLVADRAGFSVTFREYSDTQVFLRALIDGEAEMLAGVAPLRVLSRTALFSNAVGQAETRLFMQSKRLAGIDPNAIEGMTLAVVGGMITAETHPILLRNTVRTFPSTGEALGALLLQRVDGLIGPSDIVGKTLAALDLGGGILPVGDALETYPRIISLHSSRGVLRPAINSALRSLESDGTLAALRAEWGVVAPATTPDVLVVGLPHYPPYSILHDDGTVSGFAVDVIWDLGARAGLPLRFRGIPAPALEIGPGPGRYDITGFIRITPDRMQRMLFTRAVEETAYSLAVRSEDAHVVTGLNALEGRRLGVVRAGEATRIARELGVAPAASFVDGDHLLEALMSGEVDAAFMPEEALRFLIQNARAQSAISLVSPVAYHAERAIAFGEDLEAARARLDAVLPGYLASPRYEALRDLWFQPPPFWTIQRFWLVVWGLCAVIAILSILLIMQHQRRRVHEARRDIAGELIDAMPVGLMLIGTDGRVAYVNEEILDATPGGRDGMMEGMDYVSAIRGLIAADTFDRQGRSDEEMLHLMTVDGLRDGFSGEFRMSNGASFIRSTRCLRGGETLLVRRDVTEERARLHLIETLNHDLAEQVRIANATNADLRALAYATSHDLKSPLNTAIMLGDMLSEDLADRMDAEEAELMADLRLTLQGMTGLIEGVLSYTNAVGRDDGLELCDLQDMAEGIVVGMSRTLNAAKADVTVRHMPQVLANPQQMHLLLSNLIVNAVKFRAPDRPPRVLVHGLPQGTGFQIRDNGIGIAPAYHQRIFELFQKLHTGHTYTGHGLGLAICQRIALNHGARIEVSSAPEQGAVFTVTFREIKNKEAA